MRWLLPLLVLVAGCDKPGRAHVDFRHDRQGGGTPIASFGGDAITAEDVSSRLAQMSPGARARYGTAEQRREYVENLARFELLAAEALRRGLHNHPEAVEASKKAMVTVLLREELDAKLPDVTDQDVRGYYDSHRSEFVRAERARLAHVFIAAPKADPRRAERKALAEEVLKKARELPQLDYQGFGALARQYSDDATSKPLEGDLRFLTFEELSARFGPEVAEAARKLSDFGQLPDAVVATDAGFHVLKLEAREAAIDLSIDQARPQIVAIVQHERRARAYDALVARLEKSSGYRFDEKALAVVEAGAAPPPK